MAIHKLGDLELLNWEEHRPVLADRRYDGSVSCLVPAQNSVALLHLRAPEGEPFIVTLDSETLYKKVLPAYGLVLHNHIDGLGEMIGGHDGDVTGVAEPKTDLVKDPV
jgi:hypothetical protein